MFYKAALTTAPVAILLMLIQNHFYGIASSVILPAAVIEND